jgi:hypothetical protein
LDIALSLPFQGEVNTSFGVLAKVSLDALTHVDGGVRVRRDVEAREGDGDERLALEVVEETFGGGWSTRKWRLRGIRFGIWH